MFKKLAKIPTFLKEVKEEVKKVKWTTRHELTAAVGVVIVTAIVLTTYIFFVDLGLSRAIQFILK